jgi:signal peptidase II
MSQRRKLLVVISIITVWLVGDLWSKHWADTTLADARHPQIIRVTADDAGKALGDLVERRFGLVPGPARDQVLASLRRLSAPLHLTASDKVFDPTTPAGKAPGFYVFWRDDLDVPPRRVDKRAPFQMKYWSSKANPDVAGQTLNTRVDEELVETTFPQWLSQRIRRVSVEGGQSLLKGRIHPTGPLSPPASASTIVKEGDVFVVQHHRVDVMGDWWKYTYAENTGAAFGFLKSVDANIRESIFAILTLLVIFMIGRIIWQTPWHHRLIHISMASVLGGAFGNLVDRVRYGYVIDFIDMDLGFMRWPTYNIADIAISVGVGLLIWEVTFHKDSPLLVDGSSSSETS